MIFMENLRLKNSDFHSTPKTHPKLIKKEKNVNWIKFVINCLDYNLFSFLL